MFRLFGTSIPKNFLLSSTVLLLTHASLMSPLNKPRGALQGPNCATSQCGQACMSFYALPNCSFESSSVIYSSGYTILKDTAGFNTPFNLTQGDDVQIMSLSYSMPSEGVADCPYIQFSFYDSTNQTAGTTYIAPGQFYTPCIEFGGTTVVGYSGVTMLVDVPEEVLDRADTDGNVDGE